MSDVDRPEYTGKINECPCCFLREENLKQADTAFKCAFCSLYPAIMMIHQKHKRLKRIFEVMDNARTMHLPETLRLMYEVLLEKIADIKD